MPSPDTDIAIVGAGCAGLSLAVHLVQSGFLGPLLLLDRRPEYGRDRTWCHFAVGQHPFEHAVSHRWPRFSVSCNERAVTVDSPRHPYQHIPADRFYARAEEILRAHPQVTIELGVDVSALEERPDAVTIETSRGTVLARLLFDSRPLGRAAKDAAGEVTLLQHFGGHEVCVEAPVFDPGEATLMDFGVPQEGGIHFLYVLPFSAHRALVESTWFGGSPRSESAYASEIADYLGERYGLSDWEVCWRERGVIPMTTAPPAAWSGGRVYPIGTRAGLAKPSTGYAFLAIQQFSRELAGRLGRRGRPRPPAARPWRSTALDRIFLTHLARHPERAPDLFVSLFERVPIDALVRFLTDTGGPADDLRVMRALPALPLTLEALRSRRLWWRR
jgi:lycopene beta-cyclase